jgi:hypothetical protein
VEILIPQKYSTAEVKKAAAKRSEFRRNSYTSGSANLDDMISLSKAVILCDAHARKFKPKQARYRAHPDKNMRRVIGNCDVCKQYGLSSLFLNERDAYEEQRKLEKFKRSLEYGNLLR